MNLPYQYAEIILEDTKRQYLVILEYYVIDGSLCMVKYRTTQCSSYSPQSLGADEGRLQAQEPVRALALRAAPGVVPHLTTATSIIAAVFLVPLPLPLMPPVADEESDSQGY